MHHQTGASDDLPPSGVNKWEALRELATARQRFGLSDRDLSVLQALASFHPAAVLSGDAGSLVVHPSNRSICERLNGMPCSTMRRHVARLVDAGMVLRRDSANGKRYARRYGDDKVAFGFDLSPLLRRFTELRAAAAEVRAEALQLRRLRETIGLMRRDLAGLLVCGEAARPELPLWPTLADLLRETARALRRKLGLDDMQALVAGLRTALAQASQGIAPPPSEPPSAAEPSTRHARNEQHHQNSKKDQFESEPGRVVPPGTASEPATGQDGNDDSKRSGSPERKAPNVPIGLVLESCPQIQSFVEGEMRHWSDLIRAADTLSPMMGIPVPVWHQAKSAMGGAEAAAVVAAMLERFDTLASPAGYLRHLTAKAARGAFSCRPMVMALARKRTARQVHSCEATVPCAVG